MRDATTWSVSCGRGTDVDVRLHVSLFVAIAALLYLGARSGGGDSAAVALAAFAVYVVSLAAHEIAHAVTAWKWGGRVECVVLGPAGGLLDHGHALDPRGDLAVALAGPAANLALSGVATLTLAATGGSIGAVFFPFAPPAQACEMSAVGVVAQTAWLNWVLALMNLLPTFPLDGARIVTALLRERVDDEAAGVRAARVGAVSAVGCFAAFWFVAPDHNAAAFLLLLLSIVGAFHTRHELRRVAEEDFHESVRYDESELTPDSDERRPHLERLGPLRRWWERRRQARLRLRLQTEREEEERADEVLARLHDYGIESLSPQDRALLERVSARYRQRH